MGEPRAKVFEYSVALDRDGVASSPGADDLTFAAGWTPDHLLLAALIECSIQSLDYHAERAGHEVAACGTASGRVTKRDTDGRYAFVEIECRIDVELSPPAVDFEALTAKAERDCFVGATLAVKPRYEWRIG